MEVNNKVAKITSIEGRVAYKDRVARGLEDAELKVASSKIWLCRSNALFLYFSSKKRRSNYGRM